MNIKEAIHVSKTLAIQPDCIDRFLCICGVVFSRGSCGGLPSEAYEDTRLSKNQNADSYTYLDCNRCSTNIHVHTYGRTDGNLFGHFDRHGDLHAHTH
jgi:hypothetical protein